MIQSAPIHRGYNTSLDERLPFHVDSPLLDFQSAVVAVDVLPDEID